MKNLITEAFVFIILFSSCNSNETQKKVEENPKQKVGKIEFVSDRNFSNGIGLAGLNSNEPDVIDTLFPFGEGNSSPKGNLHNGVVDSI